MKQEEITVINKSSNGYVKWGMLCWILGGIIGFASFAYAIRVDSSDKQFEDVNKQILNLRNDFNKHIETQNINDLKVAQSLGRIEQALGIKTQ